jgi:hypothetical protein
MCIVLMNIVSEAFCIARSIMGLVFGLSGLVLAIVTMFENDAFIKKKSKEF